MGMFFNSLPVEKIGVFLIKNSLIMKYLLSILFFQLMSIASYSQTNKSETVPLNKVILCVNATVNASVQYENEGTRINEELNCQLIETVEYRIVSNNDDKNISIEQFTNKNRMTALGKGSVVSHIEGAGDNKDDYTFSVDPEVSYPQAGITLITAGQPYKIQIYLSDFYRNCNGSASGTSRFVSGWEGDAPTWETVPIEKVQTYVSNAVRWIFESPEDLELAMRGELTELQRKLQGSFTPREDGGFFASGKVSHSYNKKDEIGMMYNGSLTISWSLQCGDLPRDDSPQITLNGCTELSIGEQSEVTAKAADEGGSFRFWAEPEEMFTIETTGTTAKLIGLSPGRGKLFVEYTSARGKTKQTSLVASCVQVQSYNNSQTIPKIPLFDIDGNKLESVQKILVNSEPKDATDLLELIPSDPGIVSAVWLGDEIELKALRTGITTLQATTNCGKTTGPIVEVEIVNCDDETIARLAEMMRIAKEEQKRAAEEIEKILGSKEFEKASDRIAESTGNLAIKTGGLIIGTLAGGTAAGKGVKTAAGLYGQASNMLDIILDGGDVVKQVSNFSQVIVEIGGTAMEQAIAGAIETLDAAEEFGEDLGALLATNIRLKGATQVYEQANRQVERISGLQSICRKGTKPQPKKEQPTANSQKPKTDPTPTPKQDVTPKPEPTNPTPKTEESTAQEPQTEEPTTDDEVLVDPERPPIPPRQVGLPYESGDCGCDKSRALSPTSESFSAMQTGFENLQKCVDNFSSGPLTEYIKTLKEWTTVTEELGKAVNTGSTEFESTAKEAVPVIESLLVRTKSFDEAGKTFLDEFKACPESMKAGAEVLNSANKITLESLKVKY